MAEGSCGRKKKNKCQIKDAFHPKIVSYQQPKMHRVGRISLRNGVGLKRRAGVVFETCGGTSTRPNNKGLRVTFITLGPIIAYRVVCVAKYGVASRYIA